SLSTSFFSHHTPTTAIHTLSLHDALPILLPPQHLAQVLAVDVADIELRVPLLQSHERDLPPVRRPGRRIDRVQTELELPLHRPRWNLDQVERVLAAALGRKRDPALVGRPGDGGVEEAKRLEGPSALALDELLEHPA